jgi:hypothetical protein
MTSSGAPMPLLPMARREGRVAGNCMIQSWFRLIVLIVIPACAAMTGNVCLQVP